MRTECYFFPVFVIRRRLPCRRSCPGEEPNHHWRSRQSGPRARLLKPAPRRAPDGRLEGEQCPYCHYPDSNTCTILSACTVPPARTRSRSDPQAGASSGHSATSPPTMRGRRPAVAGMPSPARQPRARAPAEPVTPGQPGPGTHRHCPAHAGQPHRYRPGRAPAAIDRQRSCGNAANRHRTDAASPRSPTPDPPRGDVRHRAHEGQC